MSYFGEAFEVKAGLDPVEALEQVLAGDRPCCMTKLLLHQPYPKTGYTFDDVLGLMLDKHMLPIFLLRDYFDRNVSRLLATEEQKWEGESYETVMAYPPERFVGQCRFVSDLNRKLLDKLKPAQPLILNYGDMLTRWPSVLRNIQKVLGLDPISLPKATKRQRTKPVSYHFTNHAEIMELYRLKERHLFRAETSPELFAGPKEEVPRRLR